MGWYSDLCVLIVEVLDEALAPSSMEQKRRWLDRDLGVERERLIRQAEIIDGIRSRQHMWGTR